MFKLTIATGNSAFQDGQRGSELARILRIIANYVEIEGDSENGIDSCIRDDNGNRVGGYTLSEIDGE